MLSIKKMEGITLLSDSEMNAIKGKGNCGWRDNDGNWNMAYDYNGNGGTIDDAQEMAVAVGDGHWCCDSCPWNATMEG